MAEEEKNGTPESGAEKADEKPTDSGESKAENAEGKADGAENKSEGAGGSGKEAESGGNDKKSDRQAKKDAKLDAKMKKDIVSGYVPGEPKRGIAEQIRIIKERRLLRKDLKSKGITKKKDFEDIAEALGLVLWKCHPFFIWWHHAWKALLAGAGLKWLLGAAAAALATVFLVSVITEEKGSFTINLTGDMLKNGYTLSESADFKKPVSRLFADRLDEVNNITIADIDKDVDNGEGAHNGQHYFAYTFYIKSGAEEPTSYAWFFRLKGESLNVSKAVWVMLFEDGKQLIYSRPMENGSPEEIFGFEEPIPFESAAYSADQYYVKYDEGIPKYGIKTTPYATEDTVAQGLIENIQPGEVHKYTVVLWIEGYDPDCTDDIFGGFAKFEMEFDKVEDEDDNSIFDGSIFREEFESVEPIKKPEEENPSEGSDENLAG